ncbi:hypothetical protein Bxe_C0202 [Paraburkholderia xenovorans LB400]|uniref:Uncharacterized protein n=1 Tax=Paraburkholderia xenovorans (strain LB400) TaxID=266265 RepID=Q13IG3_PARXL|nr:hypothetical protein Bxe_C0202 [Paraburkholderia xenovorans LB400]HCE71531.1 hypothetical protein [Ruegeria sp.]
MLPAFFAPEIVGRQQITDAFRQTFAPLAFLIQHCAAGLIAIEGNRARANWSVSEWFRTIGVRLREPLKPPINGKRPERKCARAVKCRPARRAVRFPEKNLDRTALTWDWLFTS